MGLAQAGVVARVLGSPCPLAVAAVLLSDGAASYSVGSGHGGKWETSWEKALREDREL